MAQRRLIIHAPSVHSGGGLVLLRQLLEAVDARRVAMLILDRRTEGGLAVPAGVPCRWFAPTPASRLAAELELRNATDSDTVLCLGALPPLFRLRARVAVFVQNRNIAGTSPLSQFGMRVGARIALERAWFRVWAGHADEFIVQTPSMASLLRQRFGERVAVRIMPFDQDSEKVARRRGAVEGGQPARRDFVYVSSGDAHKNHDRLLAAWRLLADEGLYPSLCLTLDPRRHPDLCARVAQAVQRFGLKIENTGDLSRAAVIDLYRSSRALIFPSTSESLGLPLIEARRYGAAVLASELDFVRDVLDPEESFDPWSEVSIARAVKRFLQRPEAPLELLGPRQFLDLLDGPAA